MEADAVEHDEVGGNCSANCRRGCKSHEPVRNREVSSLHFGYAIYVDGRRLVHRVLHCFEKPAKVADDLKALDAAVARADGLAGVDRIFETSGQVGEIEQEVVKLSGSGEKKAGEGFQRRLLTLIAKPRIVEQILIVQSELPQRVLK